MQTSRGGIDVVAAGAPNGFTTKATSSRPGPSWSAGQGSMNTSPLELAAYVGEVRSYVA